MMKQLASTRLIQKDLSIISVSVMLLITLLKRKDSPTFISKSKSKRCYNEFYHTVFDTTVIS